MEKTEEYILPSLRIFCGYFLNLLLFYPLFGAIFGKLI